MSGTQQTGTHHSCKAWISTKPILVLGLGNVLLHDEGIGVCVVERLQRRYQLPDCVEILDGGTAGMSLLDIIAQRDELIVVDAVKTGRSPGSLVKLYNGAIVNLFRPRMSPHQLALTDILAVLTFNGEEPNNVTVLGVEPVDLTTGIGLSRAVGQQIEPLIGMILDELSAFGFSAVPNISNSSVESEYSRSSDFIRSLQ